MTLSTTLSVLLLTSSMTYASSLEVYQDQTLYTYASKSSFIGLTKGVKAKCEGNTIALHVLAKCPGDKRLCQEVISLRDSEQKLNAIKANTKVLEHLITLPQPTSFDGKKWIKTAQIVGEEQARLFNEEKLSEESYNLKQKKLQKQAPSEDTLVSDEICQNEMELTIPYGYVSFSTAYEANIINDKEIEVTQNLSIVNRSGIDIMADDAMFYYRNAKQYVRPVYFSPWEVSKYEERIRKRVLKRSKAKSAMRDAPMMEVAMAAPVDNLRPVAKYMDAREYQISHLNLPSTGVPVDVKVMSWKSPLNCEIKAYTYTNTNAFTVCSFEPKYQIDSNTWTIKADKVTLNDNASGEYREGKYHLYTKIDEDIKILRKQIVNKERETGIFGGTARKKDGFVLTLTNKSDKAKTLTLVDRIPTSTTDEIEVKLLEIKSTKKVNYKMLKEGKVEMKVTLDAKESKKIEVLFEISYDKDLKVSY